MRRVAGTAEDEALSPGTLAAVALGGALGACARYGLTSAFGAPPGEQEGFPYGVFGVNAVGCALIGVLMVLLTERPGPVRPWLRPLLGVGLLGGFTSFSVYAADTVGLLEEAAYATAVGYGVGTVAVAMVAVWWGTVVSRWAFGGRAPWGPRAAGTR